MAVECVDGQVERLPLGANALIFFHTLTTALKIRMALDFIRIDFFFQTHFLKV